MAKKKKQNSRSVKNTSVKSSTMENLMEKRKERNEFMKNQPLLYLIFALIAFFLGNYLFDLVAQYF